MAQPPTRRNLSSSLYLCLPHSADTSLLAPEPGQALTWRGDEAHSYQHQQVCFPPEGRPHGGHYRLGRAAETSLSPAQGASGWRPRGTWGGRGMGRPRS